jgi:hypothetical protein
MLPRLTHTCFYLFLVEERVLCELGKVIQAGEIKITAAGTRAVRATLKVRSTLMQEVIIDVQERKKIKTMLDVLTVVGGTLEDLNKGVSNQSKGEKP